MTIDHLYRQNGFQARFWVQHREWGGTCAFVVSVGGQTVGPLTGHAGTGGTNTVVVRRYDVRSGRALSSPAGVELEGPNDKHYALIAEPRWSRAAQ